MIEFGQYRYDPESRILYRGDEEMLLPPRVLAVLESLLKRPGEIVPKEDLLASAWEGAFVGEDSLTQAISQLRQVLDDDPQRPDYIQTVPRRGYRFIAEVSRPLKSDLASGPERGTPEASSDADAPPSADAAPGAGEPLQSGSRLGRYEVLDRAGTGAMGEVWRARDHALDREVALKLVPFEFATDPRAMERFRREARMLAALAHPNIATIHTVEERDGNRFIVMELVEGVTLRDMLEDRPLAIEEALQYGLQIARGLEAAHGRGIIHRDLKPSNVAVTDDGQVKLLDFGLAKDVERGADEATSDPTLLTRTGALLGTAPYMSPEQARGKEVDQGTDIWSFGCVLYEMLTGRRPFAGEDAQEVLAAVLRDEPEWTLLPGATPLLVRALLRRCLSKDPDRRWHHIADVRLELEEAADPDRVETEEFPFGADATGRRSWLPVGLALAAGIALGAVGMWMAGSSDARLGVGASSGSVGARFSVDRSELRLNLFQLNTLALSPDGTQLVYVHEPDEPGAPTQLYRRPIDSFEGEPIAGTENGHGPFFSPDGEWIGFFNELTARLQKVPIWGGTPTDLAPIRIWSREATWTTDGHIIYSPGFNSGLYRVPEGGGEPEQLTRPDITAGVKTHRQPFVLPGDEAVLFTVGDSTIRSFDDAAIVLARLDGGGGEPRVLVEGGSSPAYLPTGHLLYARDGTLVAAPFDLESLEVGTPRTVLEGVATAPAMGSAEYAVARNGTLAYMPGDTTLFHTRVMRVDHTGEVEALPLPPNAYTELRISPGGRRVLLRIEGANAHFWAYDMVRQILDPVTTAWDNQAGVWAPDGRQIVHMVSKGEVHEAVVSSIDGSTEARVLRAGPFVSFSSWSHDGRWILYSVPVPGEGNNVMALSPDAPEEPVEVVASRFNEGGAVFSPDGGYIAFSSDESGRSEVYVQSFPGGGGRVRVSTTGGSAPRWSPDGETLYYRNGDTTMAVDVELGDPPEVGRPVALFDFEARGEYDVAADGSGFLFVGPSGSSPTWKIRVVLNWFRQVDRTVPGAL